MVEIRTFADGAAELARFLRRVWREAAGGPVPVPLWSESFLDWQFFSNPRHEQRYLLAAYEGSRVVATFLALDGEARTPERGLQRVSCGSWLTVDPEFRRQSIGPRLVSEMVSRHEELGSQGILGVAVPAGPGASLDFWRSFARACPQQVELPSKVGFWARVLDGGRLAKGLSRRSDRALARIGGLLPARVPAAPGGSTRRVREEDLDDCLRLLRGAADGLDLCPAWTRESLSRQLLSDTPRTLVTTRDGRVRGFCSYHELELMGRASISSALIDFFVVDPGVSLRHSDELLGATLSAMREDAVDLALATRSPMFERMPLALRGFMPVDFGYEWVQIRIRPEFQPCWSSRVHLQLR